MFKVSNTNLCFKKGDSFWNRPFFKWFLISFIMLLMIGSTDVVFADDVKLESDDEDGLLKLHEDMDGVLHVDNGWMYQDIVRSIGWFFIKVLVWIVDYFENAVDTLLGWNSFFKSSEISDLMNKLTPFIMGLFLLSLMYVGYLIMFNKVEKRNEIALNVIMAFLLIFIIPASMPYLDEVFKVGHEELKASSPTLDLTESIVKMNVVDLKYYEENKFNFNTVPKPIKKIKGGKSEGSANYTKGNTIVSDDPDPISITEKIDGHETKDDYIKKVKKNHKIAYDLFKTKAIPDGSGGKVLVELEKNAVPTTKIGRETYFRYHVNWGTAFFTLIIVGVALAITIIKVARIIFELAFHGIFVMAISATDLTGGQRTKKVVTEIVSSFAVLLVMVLIIKLFIYYTNWTIGLSGSMGWIGSALMLLAGAWALLDAPNIVERVLGIDAGLRSGYGALMGAYAGSKMIGSGAKGLAKGIGAVPKGVSSATQFGKGMLGKSPIKEGSKGVKPMPESKGGDPLGGLKNNESSKSSIPNQNNKTGNISSIPSSSIIGGNESQSLMTNENSSGSIPESDDFIKPNDNPYNTGYGVYSGSQAGQRNADLKARSYNSGVKARQNLTSFGKSLGNVGMLGTRLVRNPIQSTKNLGGMAMARASEMKSSMAAMPASIASSVSQSVGGFNQASKIPIGQSAVSDNVEIDSATTQQESSSNIGVIPSRVSTTTNPSNGKSMKITQQGVQNLKRSVNAIQSNGGTINTSQGQVSVKTPQVQKVKGVDVQDKALVNTATTKQETAMSNISGARMSSKHSPATGKNIAVTQKGVQNVKRSVNTIQSNGGTINTSQGQVSVKAPQSQNLKDVNVQDKAFVDTTTTRKETTTSSVSGARMSTRHSPARGKSITVAQNEMQNVKRSVNVTQKNGGTINASQSQKLNDVNVQDKGFTKKPRTSINDNNIRKD